MYNAESGKRIVISEALSLSVYSSAVRAGPLLTFHHGFCLCVFNIRQYLISMIIITVAVGQSGPKCNQT